MADIFTKPLPEPSFTKFRERMMGWKSQASRTRYIIAMKWGSVSIQVNSAALEGKGCPRLDAHLYTICPNARTPLSTVWSSPMHRPDPRLRERVSTPGIHTQYVTKCMHPRFAPRKGVFQYTNVLRSESRRDSTWEWTANCEYKLQYVSFLMQVPKQMMCVPYEGDPLQS
jgi:hypothetical protein